MITWSFYELAWYLSQRPMNYVSRSHFVARIIKYSILFVRIVVLQSRERLHHLILLWFELNTFLSLPVKQCDSAAFGRLKTFFVAVKWLDDERDGEQYCVNIQMESTEMAYFTCYSIYCSYGQKSGWRYGKSSLSTYTTTHSHTNDWCPHVEECYIVSVSIVSI